ncbi:hypothetical protein [Acetobacter okinawensis]|uniref:hypothetical protein n=1 Tax=Acetobacter okinawensis TaxID=1076594 RepID=UPI0020A087B9|nr:hypothetical protein [Acetobacter okinawensis]MCP1213541.1 hypothetical protein [Acetobacter okinawensis]
MGHGFYEQGTPAWSGKEALSHVGIPVIGNMGQDKLKLIQLVGFLGHMPIIDTIESEKSVPIIG